MGCDCDKYIDCGDPPREGGTSSGYEGYTHKYSNTSRVSNLPFEYSHKVEREFKCYFGWDRTVDMGYALIGCFSPSGDEGTTCDTSSSATPSCTQSEKCIMETNTLYYIDRQRDIFVWKNVKEELRWEADSGGKVAKFKIKFGQGYFHKIIIKNNIKTTGTETFWMSVKGVKTELASQTYQYNPFPATEGGGATWGLYGDTIQRGLDPSQPSPATDVAMILLFPLVPKQAIPQDNDVIAWGFYDYNSTEAGFVESSLPKDDGGKDHFYPYWLRAMPLDPLWRATADSRYGVIYSAGQMNLSGRTDWFCTEPIVNEMPFGSITLDSEENLMASLLLQFGQHADSKGVVYNKTSFGDLFKALTEKGIQLNTFTKFDPIGVL